MYIQWLFNILIFNIYCTMFCNISMCIQCILNVYSICIQCVFNVYLMWIQCVFNVYSMYFQCILNIYYDDANGWYLFTKLQPCSYISTFCVAIVYLYINFEANDSHLLTHCHTPNLEMLSHLKRYVRWATKCFYLWCFHVLLYIVHPSIVLSLTPIKKEYLRDLSMTLYKRKMTISRLYDNINMLLKCTVHSLPLKLNDGVFSVSSFCIKFRTN